MGYGIGRINSAKSADTGSLAGKCWMQSTNKECRRRKKNGLPIEGHTAARARGGMAKVNMNTESMMVAKRYTAFIDPPCGDVAHAFAGQELLVRQATTIAVARKGASAASKS